MMSGEDRFNKAYRRFHIDFHTPEFLPEAIKKFDPEKFVSSLVKGKVQAVNLFAKCHYGNSYYNTRAGHKHSGLEQDMLGELVQECKRHNIYVIAYYSMGTDWYASTTYPDWQQVDVKGDPIKMGPWRNVCFNSPYTEKLMLPQLEEIASGYDIDGFWLDMVFVLKDGCFCRYCQEKFRAEYGRELFKEKGSPLHKGFKLKTVEEGLRKAYTLIKRLNPALVITANGSGTIGDHEGLTTLSCRRADGLVDYSSVESQPGYEGYRYLSRQARYARILGRPFELLNVRFVTRWGDWTIKPDVQLKYEVSVMMSSGGIITFGDQANPDGTLDEGVYEKLGQLYTFVEEREKFCSGSESISDTAVLFTDGLSSQLNGADAVLTDLNYQFNLIDEEELKNLKGYSLLILPETGPLRKESLDAIKKFVSEGGLLLATGNSTLEEGKGFGLSDVYGVNFLRHSDYSVIYTDRTFLASARIPLLIKERLLETEIRDAEEMVKAVYPSCEPTPERFVSHQHSNAGPESPFPLAVFHPYGKGKVVYIAVNIFSVYWQTQHWWLKDIIDKLISKLSYKPIISVKSEGTVTAYLRKKDNQLLLHLVNFHTGKATGSRYVPIESIPPLYGLEIKIKTEKPEEIFLEPEGKSLEFDYESGYTVCKIPCLEIYSMLRLVKQ